MHRIRVDRYVGFNKDFWRVVCVHCGIAADGLGVFEAGQVEDVLSRRMCVVVVAGSTRNRAGSGGPRNSAVSDERLLAMWVRGLSESVPLSTSPTETGMSPT